MNDTVTTVLRVAFLVILIWVLAALTGTSARASVSSSGFRARIGKGGGCGRGRGPRRRPRWAWGSNGMVGELIPTTGTQPQLVGLSEF
jgi:hypothetical protein